MFIILSPIILVATFNVIASMIMLVKDKTRDIAILRTVGATRGVVLRIFMLSGPASAWSGPCWASCSASRSPPISGRSVRWCRTCCTSTCSTPRSIS